MWVFLKEEFKGINDSWDWGGDREDLGKGDEVWGLIGKIYEKWFIMSRKREVRTRSSFEGKVIILLGFWWYLSRKFEKVDRKIFFV